MRILFIILFFAFGHLFAQTGPAGIGTNDGTSALKLWLDAGKRVCNDSLGKKTAIDSERTLCALADRNSQLASTPFGRSGGLLLTITSFKKYNTGFSSVETKTSDTQNWIDLPQIAVAAIPLSRQALGGSSKSDQNRAMARPTPPWHPRILGAANSR